MFRNLKNKNRKFDVIAIRLIKVSPIWNDNNKKKCNTSINFNKMVLFENSYTILLK